jgi:hypothetical protein
MVGERSQSSGRNLPTVRLRAAELTSKYGTYEGSRRAAINTCRWDSPRDSHRFKVKGIARPAPPISPVIPPEYLGILQFSENLHPDIRELCWTIADHPQDYPLSESTLCTESSLENALA